jgi:hypothetical protein
VLEAGTRSSALRGHALEIHKLAARGMLNITSPGLVGPQAGKPHRVRSQPVVLLSPEPVPPRTALVLPARPMASPVPG